LQALLKGVLPEVEQAELTSHLDECTTCQQKLEELAFDGSSWPRFAPSPEMQAAPMESALQRAIQGLQDKARLHQPEPEQDPDEEISLSFLKPSDKPGVLGCLDCYEVTEAIGRGGMGLVLKALDPSLNRYVAIKLLAPQLATSAAARKRFAREARAAAAVSHEHVVSIYAVDEIEEGLPYLVMEWVPGPSLQERLDGNGPLEIKEILRIGMQTAAGLAAAHAQGVIHRDIKPANILLENCIERVKITDFGLARTVDDATLTQSGVLAGTPQYMAPEQARGEPHDHRADLFSLGSVLYTMCTGRQPFRASSTLAVLRRVSDDTARPIQELNPELPEWLAEIIETLHSKSPPDRFQSAAEVAEVLGQHLAHLQQPTVVPRPWSGRAPRRRRNESPARASEPRSKSSARKWALAAAVLFVGLGGLGVAEATGSTELTTYVATVLRLRTAEGTLVVEVDDPDIHISVDTNGKEIVITGAGIHEIRLRPATISLKQPRTAWWSRKNSSRSRAMASRS
jgi:serine/threonine protein kinase